MASYFDIEDVIDPAHTRRWIAALFDDGDPEWWAGQAPAEH